MRCGRPDARVLFLLTTNRPEVLEPALAGRPGRIDQAIEIGLPEDRDTRATPAGCNCRTKRSPP